MGECPLPPSGKKKKNCYGKKAESEKCPPSQELGNFICREDLTISGIVCGNEDLSANQRSNKKRSGFFSQKRLTPRQEFLATPLVYSDQFYFNTPEKVMFRIGHVRRIIIQVHVDLYSKLSYV